MPNKMIIDASHPEETRVVVLRGNRVEEFDFESANKKPLRGNIYLAKVTRVEPSLQAAFIDYGGNRHGFLAFSEIHPDYYQIPVADRQALLEEEARSHREDEEEPSGERRSRRHRRPRPPEAEMRARAPASGSPRPPPSEESAARPSETPSRRTDLTRIRPPERRSTSVARPTPCIARRAARRTSTPRREAPEDAHRSARRAAPTIPPANDDEDDEDDEVTTLDGGAEERAPSARPARTDDEGEAIEQVGGDAMEEMPRRAPRLRRQYKIQEVIKRRQVLLVQVVKEERGNKGAALTTYLSLAGRYSVLMPNTARGGGISRKITNARTAAG